jgi:hypothetical protein
VSSAPISPRTCAAVWGAKMEARINCLRCLSCTLVRPSLLHNCSHTRILHVSPKLLRPQMCAACLRGFGTPWQERRKTRDLALGVRVLPGLSRWALICQNPIQKLKQAPKVRKLQNRLILPTFPPKFWPLGQWLTG